MKVDKVAGSGIDEFYTPQYAIDPILKFLKPNSVILCPFDSHRSLYVKSLEIDGHAVIHSSLSDGIDFFDYCDEYLNSFDYIISNPPYSKKTEVLSRLFSLTVPFAMLVGVVGLFESRTRFNMFSSNRFEILYFDKRVSYYRSYDDQKPELNPPFSSVYVCRDILPEMICFARLQTGREKAAKSGKKGLEAIQDGTDDLDDL